MSEQRNKDADMPTGPSRPIDLDEEEIAIIHFCGEIAANMYKLVRVCMKEPAIEYESANELGRGIGRSIVRIGRVFNPQPPGSQ